MLSQLYIRNYILISELELNLQPGFTAITGETGAGKSILIGALSLILGKRADTDVLLDKSKKCIIEGRFDLPQKDYKDFFRKHELDQEDVNILRREINSSGKSRAFINDTPVNLPVLREIGERIVNIHSQHQTLLLNESGFQMGLLDGYAGNEKLLDRYSNEYSDFRKNKQELEEILEKEEKLRAEEEYLRFRFNELEEVQLKDNELRELEDEQEVLSHAEEIKGSLYEAVQHLNLSENSLLDQFASLLSMTGKIATYHKEIQELQERLEGAHIELKDIASALARIEEKVVFDPGRNDEVGQRLDVLYGLLQKHRVKEVTELISIRDELGGRLNTIDSLDMLISDKKNALSAARKKLEKTADELDKSRRKNAMPMEKEIMGTLAELGMEKSVLEVRLGDAPEFGQAGKNTLEFAFSANPGSKPAAISRIASGGELSRLMLALKSMVTRKKLLPTLILDEIDMGVSGDIAAKVGNILTRMSENIQLIAITHLPQIAAKASEHFKVFKNMAEDRTVSEVKCLSESERVDEIASMLSNETVSNSAKETAKELMGKS